MERKQYLAILLLVGVSTMAGAVIGSRMVVVQSARSEVVKAPEAAEVQKWEYRIIYFHNDKDKAEAAANALGEQGFEMVNFSDGRFAYQFVFKRPKPR